MSTAQKLIAAATDMRVRPSGHECGVWREPKRLDTTEDGRIFGKGIRSARREKLLTLIDAAAKADMRVVRLSEIEQGVSATPEERQRLRDALELR